MVRVSGLDVTEGHDEPNHSTEPNDRQSGLAGIQLLSFNQLQFCGEEGNRAASLTRQAVQAAR